MADHPELDNLAGWAFYPNDEVDALRTTVEALEAQRDEALKALEPGLARRSHLAVAEARRILGHNVTSR